MKEIKELLEQIKHEQSNKLVLNIFNDIKDELMSKPAAVKHHHSYAGGLYTHIKEVMNIAIDLFDKSPDVYNCNRDDVIIATFVHDFNKIDQYCTAPEWKKIKYQQEFDKKPRVWLNESARTVRLCSDYGLILNDVILNAVCLHHGSWSTDIDSKYGYVQTDDFTQLAILLHVADLLSSQVFDKAKKEKK